MLTAQLQSLYELLYSNHHVDSQGILETRVLQPINNEFNAQWTSTNYSTEFEKSSGELLKNYVLDELNKAAKINFGEDADIKTDTETGMQIQEAVLNKIMQESLVSLQLRVDKFNSICCELQSISKNSSDAKVATSTVRNAGVWSETDIVAFRRDDIKKELQEVVKTLCQGARLK
jgi:hypothetical protein